MHRPVVNTVDHNLVHLIAAKTHPKFDAVNKLSRPADHRHLSFWSTVRVTINKYRGILCN